MGTSWADRYEASIDDVAQAQRSEERHRDRHAFTWRWWVAVVVLAPVAGVASYYRRGTPDWPLLPHVLVVTPIFVVVVAVATAVGRRWRDQADARAAERRAAREARAARPSG